MFRSNVVNDFHNFRAVSIYIGVFFEIYFDRNIRPAQMRDFVLGVVGRRHTETSKFSSNR